MSVNIGTLRGTLELADKFTKPLIDAQREMQKATANINKLGQGMVSVGSSLTKAITVPIAGIGLLAVNEARKFESSFAGVRKTVDATEEQFAALSKGLREMARQTPINVNELNNIAEAAGQLGIKADDLLNFTQVVAETAVTTNLTSDAAAVALAQIANITGLTADKFSNLSSAIVGLGNNFATNEAAIVEFTKRLAGSGELAGLTEAQILAVSTAMLSVGVASESGATAVQKVFIKMTQAVATGNEQLELFAEASDLAVKDFVELFRRDAGAAFTAFVEGLGRDGDKAFGVLEELKLKDSRLTKAFVSLAGAGNLLRRAMDEGTTAFIENTARTKEVAERYKTFDSQLKIFINRIKDVGIELGTALIPVLIDVLKATEPIIKKIAELAKKFSELSPGQKKAVIAVTTFVAAIGPALVLVGQMVIGITGMATAFATLAPAIGAVGVALLATNPALLAAAAAIAAIAAGAKYLGDKFAEEIDRISADSRVIQDQWAAIEKEVADKNIKALQDRLTSLRKEYDHVKAKQEGINKILQVTKDRIGDVTKASKFEIETLNNFKANVSRTREELRQYDEMIKTVEAALANLQRNSPTEMPLTTPANVAAIDETRRAMEEQIEVYKDIISKVEEYGVSSTIITDAMEAMQNGFKGSFADAVRLTVQLEELKKTADGLAELPTLPALPTRLTLLPNPRLASGQGVSKDDVDIRRQVDSLEDAQARFAKTAQESTVKFLDNVGYAFDNLAYLFDSMEGGFSDMLATLFNVLGTLANVASNFASATGAAASGASTAAASAASAFGVVVQILVELYQLGTSLIESSRQKRFATPVEAGIVGGNRHGQAVANRGGALNQQQVMDVVRGMYDMFDQISIALGQFVTDLATISIAVRNDGEKFVLEVGGVAHGIFDTLEDAIEYGLQVAFSTATIEGLGENMQRALDRGMAGLSLEQFLDLVPFIQALDDQAAGMSLSLSSATLDARRFLSEMDAWSRQLFATGASIEEVMALREQVLAQRKRELELEGLSLAGVSTRIDSLRAWIDSVTAFNTAADEESKRQRELAAAAESSREAISGSGGSRRGREGGLQGGIDSLGDAADGALGPVIALFGEIDDTGPAVADAAAEARRFNEELIAMVTAATMLQEQIGIASRILDFAEKYGMQTESNERLKRMVAEMEFNLAKIQIILAVKQLEIAHEMGLITNAQLAQWRRFAQEVADFEWPGMPTVRQARGTGRQQAEDERQRALETFEESAHSLAQSLAGVSDASQRYLDDLEALRLAAEQGRVEAGRLAQAEADLAAVRLRDLAQPFADAAALAGQSPLAATIADLRQRAEDALASALTMAAGNPAAYADAVAAIEAGLAAQIQAAVASVLLSLGGDVTRLQAQHEAATAAIQYLLDNLDELDLTARQVADTVRDGLLPDLLSILTAQAKRVGETKLAAELERRSAELQQALARLQFESLVAQLELAGALTPALARLVERGRELFSLPTKAPDTPDPNDEDSRSNDPGARRDFRAAVAAMARDAMLGAMSGLRDFLDKAADLRRMLDELTLAESRRAEAIALLEAELRRQRGAFVESMLSTIGQLGVNLTDLGVDTKAFASAMLELQRVQILTALTTQEARDAFAAFGIDAEELARRLAEVDLGGPTGPGPDPNAQDPFGDADLIARRAAIRSGTYIPPGGSSGTDPASRTLADIIAEMARDALTPMEEIRADWQDMIAEINAATGTAEERARALEMAEEIFYRRRMELIEQSQEGVKQLLADLRGTTLGGRTLDQQLAFQQAEFMRLAGQAASGDLEALDQVAEQGRTLLSLLDEMLGGATGSTGAGRAATELRGQITAILESLLQQDYGDGQQQQQQQSFDFIGNELADMRSSSEEDQRQLRMLLVELQRQAQLADDRRIRGLGDALAYILSRQPGAVGPTV